MELIRTIKKLNNKESDCPIRLESGGLFKASEDMPRCFKIAFKALRSDVSALYIDVACYDRDGNVLSIIEGISCVEGENIIDSPSLMTEYGAVVVRSVMLDDGIWESDEALKPDFDVTAKMERLDQTDRLPLIDDKALKTEKFISESLETPKKSKKKIAWIFALLLIIILCASAALGYNYFRKSEAVYSSAIELYNNEKFEEAFNALKTADAFIYIGDKGKEIDWCLGICYARQRDFINAAAYFRDLGDYRKSRENYRSIMEAYSGILSKGDAHKVGLTPDGKITSSGDNTYGQCDVGGFINIIEVSAGGNHTVAINRANKCIARGDNEKGQCNIGKWENIFDISAGKYHTVAVNNLGRAIATGDNTYGQCDVDNWSGIVSVSAGAYHTVGLTIDGRVVAAGRNKDGECNTEQWQNVVQVAAGDGYTVALTYDGEILRCGNNQHNLAETVSVESVKGDLVFVTGKGEISDTGLLQTGICKETVTIFKR